MEARTFQCRSACRPRAAGRMAGPSAMVVIPGASTSRAAQSFAVKLCSSRRCGAPFRRPLRRFLRPALHPPPVGRPGDASRRGSRGDSRLSQSTRLLAALAQRITMALWVAAPGRDEIAMACLLADALQAVRLARWVGSALGRPPRANSPCRLRVRAARLRPSRPCRPLARCDRAERGITCLDGRRHRHDDDRGHDAGEPGSRRPAASRHAGDRGRLCLRARRGTRAHRGGYGRRTRCMLHLVAVGWIAAFAGFIILFGPMLARART